MGLLQLVGHVREDCDGGFPQQGAQVRDVSRRDGAVILSRPAGSITVAIGRCNFLSVQALSTICCQREPPWN